MRARNIKPALFTNEVLGSADPLLTILFAGLWCAADREGRLEDRPLRIRAEVFPYRPQFDADKGIAWLADQGFVRRYEVHGIKIIQIIEFRKHQHPHKNETHSVLPAAARASTTKARRATVKGPKRDGPRHEASQPLDEGLRLIPDSLIPDSGSLIPDSPPEAGGGAGGKFRATRSTTTRLPADFELTEKRRAIAVTENLDPERTFAKFKTYWKSAGGEKARKLDWDATWQHWCMGDHDRQTVNGAGKTHTPRKTRFAEMTDHLRGQPSEK